MYILSHSDCLSISFDFAAFNVFFTSGNYPDPIEEIGKVNVIISKTGNFIPSPYKRRIVKVCSYKLYFFSNRARTTTPSTSSATSIIPPAIFSSFWSSQHFAAGIINFCCSKIISPLYV